MITIVEILELTTDRQVTHGRPLLLAINPDAVSVWRFSSPLSGRHLSWIRSDDAFSPHAIYLLSAPSSENAVTMTPGTHLHVSEPLMSYHSITLLMHTQARYLQPAYVQGQKQFYLAGLILR
jgi:hypothetical protein